MAAKVTVKMPTGDKDLAIGGGLEGAERTQRETVNWTPSMQSPDQVVNAVKPMADARGRDMVQNDGYATGAVALHRDNIVGSQFRLNARPNIRALGLDEMWAEEFQEVVESRFNLVAESDDNWFDAAGRNNLTGLIRLAVGGFVMTGEVLATGEWNRTVNRPFKTCVQQVSPDRLSNPNGESDRYNLRRGVQLGSRGQPIGYHIRQAYPTEAYMDQFERQYTWKYVPARKTWGRAQVCHIVEQLLPDQNRGVADMVSVLKTMRMTKRYQEVVLQQAVVAATYAAAIESELPSEVVFQQLGGGATADDPFSPMAQYLQSYMGALGSYLDEAKGINIDSVKMPHLFPGTKLNVKPIGSPGGVGEGFEQSMLRHIASSLGLSYEQFSRDYTKTNYSSARASINETWKFMQARKKVVADRFASFIYRLWLEEEILAGNVPLPAGKTASWFYEPLVKDALSSCSWIGASRGQIDELKETQAAVMRIRNNLSTHEIEAAKLGSDWRDLFSQRARELRKMETLGLSPNLDEARPTNNDQEDAE